MWQKLAFALAGIAVTSPVATAAQDVPREVNITMGSTPGWVPSEELESEVISTWTRFYTLVDAEDYAGAWAMLDDGLRADLPLEEFIASQSGSRKENGAVEDRNRIKLTWTKDAPGLPEPGTYVAIDADNQHSKQTRHCGYTILYRAPGSNSFVINRLHDVFLSEEMIQSVRDRSGEMQLELIWRLVSSDCPNHVPPPLPDVVNYGVGYSSADEAYAAISTKPGLERRVENGWELFFDEANLTAWSFAPRGDQHYPTVIKRRVEPAEGGGSRLSMSMHCGVEKRVCDDLYFEMAATNGLIEVSFE